MFLVSEYKSQCQLENKVVSLLHGKIRIEILEIRLVRYGMNNRVAVTNIEVKAGSEIIIYPGKKFKIEFINVNGLLGVGAILK